MPPHARTLLAHFLRLSAPAASDAALLTQWTDRHDEEAFAELVARHGPMVLGVCRRVLGDAQHAEDAFQATFLVLARKAAHLRRPKSLPGFLYGVALRLAKKARGAVRRRPTQAYPASGEPADPQPHPLDALSGRELLALIDEEVNRLPETYRLPLLLCVLQERSVEEAARLLGWGAGSVRGRLARGKQRLRERLIRRGVCLSTGAIALLAPAAVPERLLAASLRNLTGPASPTVQALAAGSVPPVKWKAALLVLFSAAVALGVGLPFLFAPEPEPPRAPAVVAQAKDEPRRDLQGDPLPAGAVARLGTLRFRVPGEIESLALASDGKTIAASSRAGVFLFDAASGKRLQRLPASEFKWFSAKLLTFSPDGKRLAGREGVVRIWELAGEWKPRDYDVKNVAWLGWSAGGKALALCLEKGSIHLRDLASGTSRRFLCKGLQRPDWYDHTPLACTMAGRTLAVADDSRQVVHVWDTADGRQRRVLRPEDRRVSALALSPDGTRLAAATAKGGQSWEKDLQVWDLTTGKLLYTVPCKNDEFRLPQFSVDGKTLVARDYWPHVCFLDAATGRERGRTGDKYAFSCLSLSPDGKTLAATEQNSGTIHLFDVATGKRKPQPAGHFNPGGIAFSPDGRRVATTGGQDGAIIVWDPATGKSLLRIRRWDRGVREVAYSADGRSLFASWNDENVWVCDAATGEKRHVIKLDDPDWPDTVQYPVWIHLSDDGKRLIAFSHYQSKKVGENSPGLGVLITGWDSSTRKQLFLRRRPGPANVSTLSADGRVAATRSSAPGRPMHLEDVATGEQLLTFPASERQPWPLAFSPDGRLLASNSFGYQDPRKSSPLDPASNTVQLWETATGAEVLALPPAVNTRADPNTRAAFSPDGRLLAVAAPYHDILVWDVARGRELRRFQGFGARVMNLAFSPDGRRLVSGLTDSTWLVWDVGPRLAEPASKLGAAGAAKAWADLAGADVPRAFQARWALASSPEESLPLLKGRLRRALPADAQRVRQFMDDLNSEHFALRTKAQAGLEQLGDLAEPALRKALADKPALEVRRRVQKVLERLRVPVTRPELLRPLRAAAVLEDIGTSAARELLVDLASGAPESRLTREAAASLGRLNRRAAWRD